MQIRFALHGICTVPDGSAQVECVPNHVRLPGGQIISILPVIEMSSDLDADDHRDLTYDEAVAFDLLLDCEARSVELEENDD